MIKYLKILSIILLLLGSQSCKNDNPQYIMETDAGSITIELYPLAAPLTVKNFLRYVENGLYTDAAFYRTVTPDNQPNNDIKIEVIQGGIHFDSTRTLFPPIQHETTNITGLLHKDGVISMARLEPGSANSEFFICIGDQPELDFGGKRNPDGQGFAAFGKVTDGMEIVKKIQLSKASGQSLDPPVIIHTILKKLIN